MAVKDWSTTAGSNTGILTGITLDGSVLTVPLLDDSFREMAAQIAAQLGKMNFAGADMASAATLNLANATGWYITVTGTVGITAMGTVAAGQVYILRFAGACTLTHNATTLILPGSVNITTAANDVATMISLGGGAWRCLAYQRSAGISFIQQRHIVTTGAITLHAETKYFHVQVQGGGGAGGASGTSAVNTGSAGGGGGSGGYASKWIVRAAGTTPACTVGAGSSGAGNGSQYVDGTDTVTCGGGAVGTAGSATNNGGTAGGAGGSATGGDYNLAGKAGDRSLVVALVAGANAQARGGEGGASPLGLGGPASIANAASGASMAGVTAPSGYGGGGSGGSTVYAGGVDSGGSGAGGVVIVTEYR